jgi:PBP1b-binding outer membrane lipoprotein LpoB
MRRIYTLLIAILLFTSCSAHKSTISKSKASKNNKAIQKRNKASIAQHKDLSPRWNILTVLKPLPYKK